MYVDPVYLNNVKLPYYDKLSPLKGKEMTTEKCYTEEDLEATKDKAFDRGYDLGYKNGYGDKRAITIADFVDGDWINCKALRENISDSLKGAECTFHVEVKHKGFILLFNNSDIPEDDPEFTQFFKDKFAFAEKH